LGYWWVNGNCWHRIDRCVLLTPWNRTVRSFQRCFPISAVRRPNSGIHVHFRAN
jgi:hypothetical protein